MNLLLYPGMPLLVGALSAIVIFLRARAHGRRNRLGIAGGFILNRLLKSPAPMQLGDLLEGTQGGDTLPREYGITSLDVRDALALMQRSSVVVLTIDGYALHPARKPQ